MSSTFIFPTNRSHISYPPSQTSGFQSKLPTRAHFPLTPLLLVSGSTGEFGPRSDMTLRAGILGQSVRLYSRIPIDSPNYSAPLKYHRSNIRPGSLTGPLYEAVALCRRGA